MTREIRSLLIANRGEIARRIARTAREMGIRTVAVYTDADRHSPYVHEADVAVPLTGTTPTETYLNRDELLKAAEWQGVDAIHPGYGFLSESTVFARAVQAAGHIWVGPSPAVIAAMGDKLAAKREAADAGVPTLASTPLGGEDPGAWLEQAAEIGYPLIIKAAAGGGGRGMRLVDQPDHLADAIVAARHEATAAFGDGVLFAERYLAAGRHVEVQIIADEHGTVLHLGERECSVQRRHQKLLEEAPSPAVDSTLRTWMGEAAVALARRIGYVNAGTVEFLLDDRGEEPSFSFLEMNTRLQVEHTVTEMVCGLDIVRLQLLVAAGEPLGFDQSDVVLYGHAVEARVCAEDPAADWLPSAGVLTRWQRGPTSGLRWDDGVATGSVVSPEFDSLLGKVVAYAPTRREAVLRLARGLRGLQVHGVTTNRDYLVEALTSTEFLAGDARTDFVQRHPPGPDPDDPQAYERAWRTFNTVTGPHLAAAALSAVVTDRDTKPWSFAPIGWRNVGGQAKEMRPSGTAWELLDAPDGFATQVMTFRRGGELWDVTYSRVSRDHPLELRRRAERPDEEPGLFNVAIRGPAGSTTTVVEIESLGEDDWFLSFGRRGQRCSVHRVGDHVHVNTLLGQSTFTTLSRFAEAALEAAAAGPVAPVPGRVVRVEVAAGDQVEPGAVLVVLEAMKVEHRVTATHAATVVEVLVRPGENVDAHQLLVRLEGLDDAEER